MDIAVLVKQVPATESTIGVADDGMTIKTESIKWVINPYDEIAVEEALRIREAQGGSVTIVTLGPDKASEAIRTALAMGADSGVLINDPAIENCDSLGIARVLAASLKELSWDLIIAGHRAVDGDNFQVGPAVAEYLNIPHISMAIKVEVADGRIKCQRAVDGGTVTLESPLPALLTTQRGLNEPRYASLPGIMKAKKKPLEIKTLSDIGLNVESVGKPQLNVINLTLPPERKGGRIIEGESAREKAAVLVKALKDEEKVF